MEEGMHKVKSEMFILSRNPWPVPALVLYSVWGTPGFPGLHPFQLQWPQEGTLSVKSSKIP